MQIQNLFILWIKIFTFNKTAISHCPLYICVYLWSMSKVLCTFAQCQKSLRPSRYDRSFKMTLYCAICVCDKYDLANDLLSWISYWIGYVLILAYLCEVRGDIPPLEGLQTKMIKLAQPKKPDSNVLCD